MNYQNAIEEALIKTKANITRFGDLFPHTSKDEVYQLNPNDNWTNGFWVGILWLCYQYSGDQAYRDAAQSAVERMKERLDLDQHLDTHDIGFLYTPATVAQWMIDEDQQARLASIKAADRLMKRYRKELGLIQAWGPLGDPNQGGRIIIDCLMNMPLLFWASQETKHDHYQAAAVQFIEKARRYLMRGDDSSYHTFYFDQVTGEPIGGATQQGYKDGSTWTRGQAWAIYGFALAYRYTHNPAYLETSKRAARYFIKHLPENYVAHWDFDVPIDDQIKPDSSASAIAVCGMHELLTWLGTEDSDYTKFSQAIEKTMQSLTADYTTEHGSEGLIDHGSYSVRENKSPDDYTIWGDYFYLEALLRLEKGYTGFWYA
ncbi:glycoside hydrolase family 88 protein [Amphibacillus sediminis]|uniref:glycoside hydrolase family 88 protein n=1 Tax=Amphibacillus sediminis TaxID=360185 RepID=UPI0008371195|nr:glycoside hydrolase family 88 protein [Amphibacillus sediminis]